MTRRGEFGSSWWAKQWQDVLKSFGWSSRLQRARIYVRSGRVKEVALDKGVVLAKVLGSDVRPYRVAIRIKTLTVPDWNRVVDKLLQRPLFMAKLLSGEMPNEIDDVFSEVQLSLFPATERDLQMECSCPDWANPCKHIAAVYYVLGQKFDVDPFLIFTLRGMGKTEILARLRERWSTESETDAEEPGSVPAPAMESAEDFLWEAASAGTFWSMGPEAKNLELHLQDERTVPRTLPMVWGPPPFISHQSGKAAREMVSLLADVLQNASLRAKNAVEESQRQQ